MNWDALGAIAEAVGAIGVVATLAYLAVQVRANTRALSAQSRHALSEFVLQVSMFRTEHADRYARLRDEVELTPGDREFQYWSHIQMVLHAETYFHHYELGLMPASHWEGYHRYITGYVHSRGFVEFWDDVGPAFSRNFREWIDERLVSEGLRDATGAD